MADIKRGLIRRSILGFATMMELFQQYNVEFVSSTEKFDTSTPVGRAMLNICIVFAQLEHETIQKRVTDAYYSRGQRGFHMSGAAPLWLQAGAHHHPEHPHEKVRCGHCGRALKSMGNRAGTQYLRCTKRADNMSCEGCGTLRTPEFEQFVYEAMMQKLSEFQTLTAKAETVNPRLTALNVELAQVEDEIKKLLNTLTGASAVLMSYANGKIEELDTRRQKLIKELAALNAESVSPQKIKFLSAHLGNWDNIDFEDRRQVADIILSQVHATAERVSFEWKI